MAVFDLI